MKKIILILIVALTILTLTACGESEEYSTTETTLETPTEATTVETTTEATTIETTTETTSIETTPETTTIETTTITTTEAATIASPTKGNKKEAKVPAAASAVNSSGGGSSKTSSSSSKEKDYATVESKNNSANTVWIGDKGNKYHNKNCRTLRGNKYEITYDEAIRQGRKACKVCY